MQNSRPLVYMLGLVIALALGACSHVVPLQRSTIVPAAAGAVEVAKDENKNATVKMEIKRLAPPKNLTPPKAVYLIWAKDRSDQLFRLGALRVDEDGNGEFKGVVPTASEFKIMITAEDALTAKKPSDKVVLSTSFIDAD